VLQVSSFFKGWKKFDLLALAFAMASHYQHLFHLESNQQLFLTGHSSARGHLFRTSFHRLTGKSLFEMKVDELRDAISLYSQAIEASEKHISDNNKELARRGYENRSSKKVSAKETVQL
jgi:hypothetical protein